MFHPSLEVVDEYEPWQQQATCEPAGFLFLVLVAREKGYFAEMLEVDRDAVAATRRGVPQVLGPLDVR